MNKILLFVFIVAISNIFAQQTPCTAVPMTIGSSCSATDITAPNPTNVWSANGTGGMAAAGGLVNTCNGTQTAASGNYWMTVTVPTNVTTLSFGLSNPNGAGTESDAPEFQLYQLTSGTCGSNNMVFSYVNCGGIGTLSSAVTPGATYYIRVYDDNADRDLSGENFSFCVFGTATNDLCANAITITPGTPVTGSALGGVDISYVAGACNPDGGVWYKFTTPATPGCFSFVYQQTNAGCNQISVLSATGVCTGLSILNANQSLNIYNDQGTSEPGFGTLAANTTYYVNVANTAAGGSFTLNVKPNTPTATNDVCSGAQAIGTSTVLTDNAVAGCEYSSVLAQDANISSASNPGYVCAGTIENLSWFTFTAQNNGTVTISLSNILCNNGGGGFQSGLLTGTCASYTVGTSGTPVCLAAASGTVTYNINNATAGQTYLIGMDGNAGSNCHFNVSGTNIVALPIELTMFNAKLNGNYVDLIWATASETNNNFFTLERSGDGVNFEAIGTVKGSGNSKIERNYYFQDKKPLIGTSYYRLKQTDFDTKETYSVIQSISLDKKHIFDFKLYPNPSNENEDVRLQFFSKENDLVNVIISDLTGKILSEKNILLNADAMEVNLKHHFGPGIYFIKASSNSGESINQKFIVK